MKFIIELDRNQATIFPITLEQAIDEDNEVRIIDIFVDSLDIKEMGFKVEFVENGRPGYHPKDLIKLYIYGYLNKINSSRVFEKECNRNIEVMWLIKGLAPDHNTISNFRRDNPKAIQKVFRATVQIAKHFDLIGGKLIAGDSTKLRAQNSKKNNFNQKKNRPPCSYISTKKGIKRASADVGLMFIAYNLRRIINIIGMKQLQSYLKALLFPVFSITASFKRKLSHFKPFNLLGILEEYFFKHLAESLIFGQNLPLL